MKQIRIRRETFEAIRTQAEAAYPFECCGFVIGNEAGEEVRAIDNIQNQKHAEDPIAHPRDARTAYLMDPRQQLAALREIDDRGLALKIVYHSHPDHDAYFSPTDRRQACSFDPEQPDYPEAGYLVVSVRNGQLNKAALFTWEDNLKDFAETPWVPT